jgi:hypothetical protein
MAMIVLCVYQGEHIGNVHEYKIKKVAELDGTPVHDGLESTIYICEGHYPDAEDPTFRKCICGLCLKRKTV